MPGRREAFAASSADGRMVLRRMPRRRKERRGAGCQTSLGRNRQNQDDGNRGKV